MGHKQKICLKMQANERFKKMFVPGRSKDLDKKAAAEKWDRLYGRTTTNPPISKQAYINQALRPYIYSYGTYRAYAKQNNYFFKYCEAKGCKTLEQCRPYVNEWLQQNIDKGLSAWTIKERASALGKLYQEPLRNFISTPSRNRADIVRSRGSVAQDKNFSVAKNQDCVDFARATGMRRDEVAHVRGVDLQVNERGELVLKIAGSHAKGGRGREVPIVGPHAQDIISSLRTAGEALLFDGVKSHMDVHSYRAEFATALYRALERPYDEYKNEKWLNPKTGRYEKAAYYCRGDRKGEVFDKAAMAIVSEALGHNRIDVIAGNYLR